ncbi:MAG: ATP-binding protein [Methanomassiliicoccus sp.]|nr:ATP-binding protein [Methanomassiliicoccus sp.]
MPADLRDQKNFANTYFGKSLFEISEDDVSDFVMRKIEENLTLEYKGIKALTKRAEIGKEISAFANSSGGLLLVGISEQNARDGRSKIPVGIEGNNEKCYTKEWFSQVILSGIQPHVNDIDVVSIQIDNGTSNIFIVDVPSSPFSPHMSCCDDHQYYERIGARSEPMEHYQVDYHFGKRLRPDLRPQLIVSKDPSGRHLLQLSVRIKNDGRSLAKWPFIKIEFFGCHLFEDLINPKVNERYIGHGQLPWPFVQFTSSEMAIYSNVMIDLFDVYLATTSDYIAFRLSVCGEDVVSKSFIGFAYRPKLVGQIEKSPKPVEMPVFPIEDINDTIEYLVTIAPKATEDGNTPTQGRKRGFGWLYQRLLFVDKSDKEIDELIDKLEVEYEERFMAMIGDKQINPPK